MKLLGSTENKITKYKNGENVSHLEITEVVLVHCKIVNNDYQQDLRVFWQFIRNYQFTDQNSQLLEIEDKINLTLVIKQYKCVIQLSQKIEYM